MSADGWTNVRDKKKEKNASKQKELAAQRAIEKGRRTFAQNNFPEFDIPKDFDRRVRQNPESVEAIVSKILHGVSDRKPSKKTSQKSKERKPSERKAKKPRVWGERELVEEVLKILKSEPGQWLHVSAVGNRMEEITSHSWNKQFKPKHGKLKKFLTAQKIFVLISEDDAGQDRVYPREVWEATRARMNKARKEKERKALEAKESSVPRSKTRGCCFRFLNSIVVIACLLILGYVTWLSYGAYDQGLTLQQVQTQLPQRVLADATFAIDQGKFLRQHLTNEYPKYMEQASSMTGATINTTCEYVTKASEAAGPMMVAAFEYVTKAREAAGPMMVVVKDKMIVAGERLKELTVEARPHLQKFRTMVSNVVEDVRQRVASWLM